MKTGLVLGLEFGESHPFTIVPCWQMPISAGHRVKVGSDGGGHACSKEVDVSRTFKGFGSVQATTDGFTSEDVKSLERPKDERIG